MSMFMFSSPRTESIEKLKMAVMVAVMLALCHCADNEGLDNNISRISVNERWKLHFLYSR